MPTFPHPAALSELAAARPGRSVVSLYLDTDPRRPDNASDNPAWLVELRNGLREIGQAIDASDDADAQQAWPEASARIEERIRELTPEERGRSLAWFTTLDGELERRVTSQLSLDEPSAHWDDRPHIAPLADLVDRGSAVAVILLDNDEMAVLRWWDGRLDDDEETGVASTLESWRDGLPGGEGGRLPRLKSHEQQVEARAEEHRSRFLKDAADQVGRALPGLAVDAIVIAHAPGTLAPFVEALPQEAADKIVQTVEAQLTGFAPADVIDQLEGPLTEVARERGRADAAAARERAAQDGTGAVDRAEVLRALAEHRVERLVLAPGASLAPSDVPAEAMSYLDGVRPELLLERVIEQAIQTGATVTVTDDPALQDAGGVAATLRW